MCRVINGGRFTVTETESAESGIPKCVVWDADGTLADIYVPGFLDRVSERGFFRGLAPYATPVKASRILADRFPEIRQYICSVPACTSYCVPEKKEWFSEFVPWIPEDRIIFPEPGTGKAEAFFAGTGTGAECAVLADDYTANLAAWEAAGGTGIKVVNLLPNHTGGVWKGRTAFVNGTPEEFAAVLAGAAYCGNAEEIPAVQ